MADILLITPPFVQPNCPYPATAYLKGYLERQGIDARQADLSVELLGKIFSSRFLGEVFADPVDTGDDNISRIRSLGPKYVLTVDTVMEFLRGRSPESAELICMPEFLPQAGRFGGMVDPGDYFGALGTSDCAKYLSTLYLQDIADYIRAAVSPHFEIVRYAEKIAVSLPRFDPLAKEIAKPYDAIDREMIALLDGYINEHNPSFVGFTVPFPGNLLSVLKCAAHIKEHHPQITVIAGGGYPSTELRHLTDPAIFRYLDHIILDGGEKNLAAIIRGEAPRNSYTSAGFNDSEGKSVPFGETPPDDKKPFDHISHSELGRPDFDGLPHGSYFSLLETPNPMLRLWSDGRWNKMTLAHGCYWARCSFCDTTLDYIKRYDTVPAGEVVDWMDAVSVVTGSRGFHFTDEAAPPKILRELSLELLRRGRNYTWWTNVRFDGAFTGDLCRLMAAAGCVAVSGGLETASDRLLEKMRKGISIESATLAMRNFLYSGIMVHGYLMYGFPTQTLQETVDSLEVVRQMFRAELLHSAFWHRYAMTVHSPSGQTPEDFGITSYRKELNPFANNEIWFEEKRGYDIFSVGKALRTALQNYMTGAGLDRPAHKWFEGKPPQTTIEETLITDHLIKPDSSRMFDAGARLVWLTPSLPEPDGEGITVHTLSRIKTIKLAPAQRDFIIEMLRQVGGLSAGITLGRAKELYEASNNDSFLAFYHSKKWDALRECGLLQLAPGADTKKE